MNCVLNLKIVRDMHVTLYNVFNNEYNIYLFYNETYLLLFNNVSPYLTPCIDDMHVLCILYYFLL